MAKLRARNDPSLPARARTEPELPLDAVDLYMAYQELDRDERGEPLTESMLDLLERSLRIDPASAEGQRARRFWRDMRRVERDFYAKERKKKQQKDKQTAGNRRGRHRQHDDEDDEE